MKNVGMTFLLCFTLTPAFAVETLTEKVEIDAPPAKVWEMVSNFGGLHLWHPSFKSTEVKKGEKSPLSPLGIERIITLESGPQMKEALISSDDKTMQLKYRLLEADEKVLPAKNYISTLTVNANDTGSLVTWQGEFDLIANTENPKNALMNAYERGLEELRLKVEQADMKDAKE